MNKISDFRPKDIVGLLIINKFYPLSFNAMCKADRIEPMDPFHISPGSAKEINKVLGIKSEPLNDQTSVLIATGFETGKYFIKRAFFLSMKLIVTPDNRLIVRGLGNYRYQNYDKFFGEVPRIFSTDLVYHYIVEHKRDDVLANIILGNITGEDILGNITGE